VQAFVVRDPIPSTRCRSLGSQTLSAIVGFETKISDPELGARQIASVAGGLLARLAGPARNGEPGAYNRKYEHAYDHQAGRVVHRRHAN